jgi:hypothetical protein
MVIESDVPRSGWELSVADQTVPFLMVELSGIILQPFSAERFDSPSRVEELFARLEDQFGFLVSIDDIWLPTFMLRREVLPGDVFRIQVEAFRTVFAMRQGRLPAESWDAFAKMLHDTPEGIEFSELETLAFRDWSNRQLINAREGYPKNRELQLRILESEEEV